MNRATHKDKWCVRHFTFAVLLGVALRPTGLLCQHKLKERVIGVSGGMEEI